MNGKDKTVVLSRRLQSIACMVTAGNRVADIGTDHAYLPIWLCQNKRIPSAIAADLRPGPLAAAKENIRRAGLEEQISLRLSNGLAAFRKGEADTLILAGMGGKLICRILESDADMLSSFREILLQPQSEVREVRLFLMRHQCRIREEDCTEDEGKFYPVIAAEPAGHFGPAVYSETELVCGPCLLQKQDPVLHTWLLTRLSVVGRLIKELQTCSGERARNRERELREEEQLLLTALQYYAM